MDSNKDYIALLRGINVGGRRKILMKDLRQICIDMGWKDVRTYIQSGNILFSASETKEVLESQLKDAISTSWGYDVPVMILSQEEWLHAFHSNPYMEQEEDISKLHLTVVKYPCVDVDINVMNEKSGDDSFQIIDQNVYILCQGKYHKSKLTNSFFEKHLSIHVPQEIGRPSPS